MFKYQCTECDLDLTEDQFKSDLLLCPSCGSRLEEIYLPKKQENEPPHPIECKQVFTHEYSDTESLFVLGELLWMGLVIFSIYFLNTFIPSQIIRNLSTGITYSTMTILTVSYLIAFSKRSPFITKYFYKSYNSSFYKYGYMTTIPIVVFVCLAFPLKYGLPYLAHKLICKEGSYSATIVGFAPSMQLFRNGIYLKEINSKSKVLFCGFKRPIYESLIIGETGSFPGTISWLGFDLDNSKIPTYAKNTATGYWKQNFQSNPKSALPFPNALYLQGRLKKGVKTK